jgi:DNA polymerase III subunit beta
MRVSVLQENLVKGLSIVRSAVGSRPTLPVLSNVLLTTEDGRLKLTATDLELSIAVWVGAKVEQEGAVTVPARIFYDLTSNLSPERVDLELNTRNQTLNLRCGGTNTNIKGIASDEFPLVPQADTNSDIVIPGAIFKDMIAEVTFSAAREDNRPVLTGIYTHFEGNTLTMASADGYRLTVRKAVLELDMTEPLTVIIPARTLQEVAKIAHDDDQVFVSAPDGRNQIMFHMGDIDVISNLIEGTFPDYERIIPRNQGTTTIVYRDEFLRACKRSEVFAKDSSNTARLSIHPAKDGGPGTVNVSSQSSEMGDNSSMIDASIEGDDMEIAFNIRYLIDVLNVLHDDQIVLETNTAADPGVVKALGRDEQQEFLYVIMPMQVGQ